MTSYATPIHPTAAPRRDRTGPVLALVGGSIAAVISIALIAAAALSFWSSGFHTSGVHTYSTPTRALTTESLDVGTGVPGWLDGSLGTIRVDPTSAGAFVGVAKTADVNAYLEQVGHDQITDLDYDPFAIDTKRLAGEGRPAMPTAQTFWAATSTGGRELEWKVRDGEWTVVVMNEDASPGVNLDAKVGAKLNLLQGLGWGLGIGGVVLGLGAIALILLGARASTRR
jgi:hypothetical protein